MTDPAPIPADHPRSLPHPAGWEHSYPSDPVSTRGCHAPVIASPQIESTTDTARFVDFVDRTSWAVLSGIAARPMPVLTMDVDRPRALISGLRFHHAVRCGRCREVTYLYTDGGTITAGLEPAGSHGKPRWFEEHQSGGYPSLPDTCPNPDCGNAQQPFTYWGVDYLYISPSGPEPIDLLNTVWTTLRAGFLEPAALADTLKRRYHQAPLPKRGYRR